MLKCMASKHVIIGRSCSGKSSVVEELKNIGYNTLEETATQVLKEKGPHGDDKEKILDAQETMFFRQLNNENCSVTKNGIVFLDRSLIDIIAYTELLLGFLPESIKQAASNVRFSSRYDRVFGLEGLPFVKDGVRIENDEKEAQSIYDKVLVKYDKFGYSIINVPVLSSAKERASFIIDNIGGWL